MVFQHRTKAKLQFQAPESPGSYKYTLFFMCDSYLGCDQEYAFDFDVQPREEMEVERAAEEGADAE